MTLFLFGFFTSPAQAEKFSARVAIIHDGDTFTVKKDDGLYLIVRLEGIDAPEAKQAFGDQASHALVDIALGRTAVIEGDQRDNYDRLIARVYIGDLYINEEMVRQGYAWVYREYAADPKLLRAEIEARKEKRGLWSDESEKRIPPWKWRELKDQREKMNNYRDTMKTFIAASTLGSVVFPTQIR
jgi:endonuclease YncB( thermonuclease family)